MIRIAHVVDNNAAYTQVPGTGMNHTIMLSYQNCKTINMVLPAYNITEVSEATVLTQNATNFPQIFRKITSSQSPWLDTAVAPGTAPNYEGWFP